MANFVILRHPVTILGTDVTNPTILLTIFSLPYLFIITSLLMCTILELTVDTSCYLGLKLTLCYTE